MSEGESPAASIERMCSTAIRRPRMIGLPPRTPGFASILRSNSCPCIIPSIDLRNWPPHLHTDFVSDGEYCRHEPPEFESTLGAQPGRLITFLRDVMRNKRLATVRADPLLRRKSSKCVQTGEPIPVEEPHSAKTSCSVLNVAVSVFGETAPNLFTSRVLSTART